MHQFFSRFTVLSTLKLMVVACLSVSMLSMLVACTGEQNDKPLLEVIKKRSKIIAGVKYDSKPFGYLDTKGELQGYDIDLMRELARRILGSKEAVDFQQVLSSTRVIALNTGTVDVTAATMTITPERQKILDFSDPYFTAHQAIIVPEESAVKDFRDLTNKTILVIMGTTGEANIKEKLVKAKYLGFKSSTDAFSALKAGRGQAMTTDDTILSGFLSDTCGFRMLPDKLSDEPYGLGFRKEPRITQGFRERVNQALADMKNDGTLDRLKQKWIDETMKPKQCS